MRSSGKRGIFLSIYRFDTHIDWSKIVMRNIEIEVARKGAVDRSGKKSWRNNCVDLRYSGDLPDRYDDRIKLLIESIGGEPALSDLIRSHKAENVFILLEIPVKSSRKIEEGYISHEILKLLVKLKIELHFWYV